MQYRVNVPGFEEQDIRVDISNLWTGPQLLLNGETAPKGKKGGQFLLHRKDGTEVVAQFRIANLLDPVPQLKVDGQPIAVAEPLKWYQWVVIALPFGLMASGGAIGGAIAGLTVVINGRVFRMDLNEPVKYVLALLVLLGAIGLFVIVVLLLRPFLYR